MDSTPRYHHYCQRCTCLGQVTLNETTADLFVCEDLVVARYGDEPGQSEAEYIHKLGLESSAFLLAAYRLYLDEKGKKPIGGTVAHPREAIQS